MRKIRLLEVAPLKAPRIIEVEHTLENLQELVGGLLQAVYPWEDRVCVLCDDEGKLKGYPPNRMLLDDDGEPYDVLVGTFYIAGLSEENFASIPDELVEKYTERFQYPEMFMRTANDHLLMFRMVSGEPPMVIG